MMKMKDTMTSNQCNNTDPLSTAVSTETSVTSGLCKNVEKKKKKTFFSKVKAIFSKSSTEAQKKVSGPLHNAVKNTYVVRENHGTCSNDLQIYGQQINDETNNEKFKIYYGINVNLTGDQRINSARGNDDNLLNSNNGNMDSAHQPATNNGSWITTTTNTSQGTETNYRDIFTKQTTMLSGPVDVGVQTKIPSCYKVYLLHKHVSNCNRRIKSHSKIKKYIIPNRDKYERPGGNESYYYNKYSSTQSIDSDESRGGDILKGKCNTKYWRENKTKKYKKNFNKSAMFHKINNIDIELSQSTDKPPSQSEILNTDTHSNIIIENEDRTIFSETSVSSSSRSFDSTERQNLKYRKTVNYKTAKIKKNRPYMQQDTNAEGSQSKSLPSLNLFRKNRNIKEIKCNSSPLVSQNAIQTRILEKKEVLKETYVNNPRNNKKTKNTFKQPFRNFYKTNDQNINEIHKKKTLGNKTTSIFNKNISNSESKNSNSAYESKKEIDNEIKIKARDNQCSGRTKLNTFKIKHDNSNSTITTDIWQTKRSAIRVNDLNTIKFDENVMKSNEKNVYQNDTIRVKQNHTYEHLFNENPDNLKLNRRPIITQPMIFFNENIKSETENEISNYFFYKCFPYKENNVRDINMRLVKQKQLLDSHSNLKIPSEQQYSFKVNHNPQMNTTKKYKDNPTIYETKKKFKNFKNKETDNSTCFPLPVNKQKLRHFINKNDNNPIKNKMDSYVPIKENDNNRSNSRFSKIQGPNCVPQFGASDKPSKKKQRKNYTFKKPSSEILKSSNLAEISFECNLENNQHHKNKQVNKKTQKSWNENYPCNKSNLEKNLNKDSKNVNQEIRMFNDIQTEKFQQKKFLPNVGVHGAFSGNIASKRKTFFAKITPMHANK